jgi:transposase InsO family protein
VTISACCTATVTATTVTTPAPIVAAVTTDLRHRSVTAGTSASGERAQSFTFEVIDGTNRHIELFVECNSSRNRVGSRRGEPDALLHHSDRRFHQVIVAPHEALRRPSTQYTSEQLQRPMADNDVVCSMSRYGNVWDNAAMAFLVAQDRARPVAQTRLISRTELCSALRSE